LNSLPGKPIKAFTPPIRRRRGPTVSGLYANPRNPQRISLPSVLKLINKVCEAMPWIRGEYLPVVRKWCELELLRLAAFNAITQLSPKERGRLSGVVRVDKQTHEAGLIRLVDDYRKLCQTQLMFERELGMTPLARAQLSDPKQSGFDLVAAMAMTDAEADEILAAGNRAGATAETPANGLAAQATPDEVADDSDEQTN
jgi:hypothetical protein